MLNVPVCHGGSRDERLMQALPEILKALSQGRVVVVHCNHSFHRAPCGLMAILKALLDIHADVTKDMILTKRDVWEGYVGEIEVGKMGRQQT